jgi:hypothetical protein
MFDPQVLSNLHVYVIEIGSAAVAALLIVRLCKEEFKKLRGRPRRRKKSEES